jgi:hypothetical protein
MARHGAHEAAARTPLAAYALEHNDNDDQRVPMDEIGWEVEFIEMSRFLEIMPLESWRTFLADEIAALADEDPGDMRWARLLTEEIEEPLVVFDSPDGLKIWDGFHRVAAALVRGLPFLKAVVGRVPTPVTERKPGL